MPPEGNDDPKPLFTDEQTEALQKIIATAVNGAISQRDKQSDKKREQDRADFKKVLDEALSQIQKPAGEEPKPGGGKKDDVEMATLRKQLAETAAKVEAAEKAAADERAKTQAIAFRDSVTQALTKHGLDAARARAALALLQQDGRVKRDEDDPERIVFNDETGGPVDLEVGLKAWLKSEPAKIFVPPTGGAGSGGRRGPNPPPRSGDKSPTFEDVGNWVLGQGKSLGE